MYILRWYVLRIHCTKKSSFPTYIKSRYNFHYFFIRWIFELRTPLPPDLRFLCDVLSSDIVAPIEDEEGAEYLMI